MKQAIKSFYGKLRYIGIRFFAISLKPKSKNEDTKRREFILNIILSSIIVLIGIMFLNNLYRKFLLGAGFHGMSPVILFIILSIFSILYLISRVGYPRLASVSFLAIYLFPVTYTVYHWGTNVTQGILLYALAIVIAGVLLNTRIAFLTTVFISSLLYVIGYAQVNSMITPDLSWRLDPMSMRDVVVIITTFTIIAIVSWLSNREIEKSLKRARSSEAALKKERDMLEIKVEERTKELRKAQMEKMQNLLRFAEFGRLSSGLFHDLINPMTAVSLNLQHIKDEGKEELVKAKTNLNQAIKATKRMEDFITAVRKQLQKQENKTYFSIDEEIKHAAQLLAHKARKNNVTIIRKKEKVNTFGNQIKFNQALTNFISNAIDSYKDMDIKNKKVFITLTNKNNTATLSVKDDGCGIPEENISKITEPFFTTKEGGIGLGLSSSKNTIENDFQGKLEIKSESGKGTEILITFPIIQNGKNQ